MHDPYERYRCEAWKIATERIGEDLRTHFEVSEELPLPLLARLSELEKRSDELVLAASYVARGRIVVARQRERIARLKSLGCFTLDHEQSLRVFASTLEIFVEHERAIRRSTLIAASR